MAFVSTDLLVITIKGIQNPEWGYTRVAPIYINDPTVFTNKNI